MKKRTLFFKKLNRMLAAAFMVPALTFFVACSDDDNNDAGDPNTIANMPGTLELAAEGSPVTANLAFVANSAWEASSEDTWFEYTPKSGQAGNVTITVTTTFNLGATKTGTLTIKHGTKTYDVKISQNGKPDLAIWEPEDLYDVDAFAPDPYNATEEMPASFEFTVKTNNDYKSLEEAPYQIMVFAANKDNNYEPIKDQQIDWVEFKIAENSPVASEGKKIVLSVKPHEEFTTIEQNGGILTQMNDRYAYITIVPKGTEVDAIFNEDGTIKEEYTGASIEQKAYTGKFGNMPAIVLDWAVLESGELSQISSMMGTTNPTKIQVTTGNFTKFEIYSEISTSATQREEPTEEGQITEEITYEVGKWLDIQVEDGQVVFTADLNLINTKLPTPSLKVKSATLEGQVYLKIYRGEDLEPLLAKHILPIKVGGHRVTGSF